MYFSILVFIVPWIIGIVHLHPKDPRLIPLIGPFASAISFLTNELWFYFGFGEVYPFSHQQTLPGLPFNAGLYVIIGCYVIFFIRKSTRPYLIIFLMALCVTLFEFILLFTGHLVYRNGWNIFWTYISYLVDFFLGYWFYLYVKKLKVMD